MRLITDILFHISEKVGTQPCKKKENYPTTTLSLGMPKSIKLQYRAFFFTVFVPCSWH